MADVRTAIDDWTGEADLTMVSATDELEFIDERLAAVRRDGTISHEVAMQRIDRLTARLRSK